ncbi:hypothetical protein LguiA_022931 [Lonicera macranthoides]
MDGKIQLQSGWSKLTEDLQVEILCKLPDKPLIRFKCVSKSYNSLVSNVCVPKILASISGLFYEHSKMSSTSKSLMDYANTTTSDSSAATEFMDTYRALVPFENPTANDFQDCCNGLILLVNSFGAAVNHLVRNPRKTPPAQYYVLNPATKQCITIPVNTAHIEARHAFLAFDPLESPNYKIVRVQRPPFFAYENYPVELDVFSSDTGEWVRHKVLFSLSVLRFNWSMHSVYLKGVLYFLSSGGYLICVYLNTPNGAVKGAAFELPGQDHEIYRQAYEIVFPGYVGVSQGCLYYLNHIGSSSLLIWLFEDDSSEGGNWILKRTINIDNLVRNRIPKERWLQTTYRRYALHPTSEEIFISIAVIIISYNPITNEVKLLYESHDKRILLRYQHFHPYTRCLVGLNNFVVPEKHRISPNL